MLRVVPLEKYPQVDYKKYMALFEVHHPLAQELQTIFTAAEDGLALSGMLPEHTKIDYHDPLTTKSGAAVLFVISDETENMSAIYVPVFSGMDSGFTIIDQFGSSLSEARVKIADMKGRDFPVVVGEDTKASKYIQFDVDNEGIIFSARPEGTDISSYGMYESANYDRWAAHFRKHASIPLLHTTAVQFLNRAA